PSARARISSSPGCSITLEIKDLTDLISERVSFISRVILHPGEDEMRALAEGCLRVLNGAETPKTYL
ncbi:MAG TPA: hypothetical protein PKW98_20020, partial [Candidatus Wallbacteria bacterium]|nr:hypothetical protein [Candidatus Wallbacteria bacterium]